MKIEKSIIEVNRILDRYEMSRIYWAIDRLAWLKKFRKAPDKVLNALAVKAAGTMDGSWYGDEPEQAIIAKYIKEV